MHTSDPFLDDLVFRPGSFRVVESDAVNVGGEISAGRNGYTACHQQGSRTGFGMATTRLSSDQP